MRLRNSLRLFPTSRMPLALTLVVVMALIGALQNVQGEDTKSSSEAAKAHAAAKALLDSKRIDSLFAANEAARADHQMASRAPDSTPEQPVTAGSLLPLPGSHPPQTLPKVKLLESVPVLHEGRLKPMITFAGHLLLQFSGRTQYEHFSAMQIIAQILFAPETSGDFRIFLINNPEVVQAMGIAPEQHRRYSFRQLEKSLPKLEKLAEKANATADDKRDLIQKEELRIFGNMLEFINLSRTFSFALPSAVYTVHLPETKAKLGLNSDQTEFSFWDLMSSAQIIAQVLEGIGNRSPEDRTKMEMEIIGLSQSMYYSSQDLRASPFCILPAPAAGPEGGVTWQSPSELLGKPDQLQSFHREFTDWSRVVSGYRSGNQTEFETGITDYLASMENRAYEPLSRTRFPLEILYQKGEPFFWSLVAYWLALLGIFGFFLVRKRWLYLASVYIFLAGYAVHVAGIVSRILIMHRPPVTSLYETFPFVAAVSILAALFIERINTKRASIGIGLLCAALLGTILLSIANRYAADGDTMHMLVAVLNSNFWLSTHVVCVTIGYSACLLAGAIGHIWLIRALLPGGSAKPERLKEIAKMVYGTLCFGLLFSFIGTVLGGIWADQSWGRFWGWDPKENGALLIVVWCIILLHAKQWGKIGNAGMAMGSVFGAIVVSLAWFGVNLLNVGLHSYGFTNGAATKLFVFVGGEMLFILLTAIGLAWENSTKARR